LSRLLQEYVFLRIILLDLQLELGEEPRKCGELSIEGLYLLPIAWISHTQYGFIFIWVVLYSSLNDHEVKESATAYPGKACIWIEMHIMDSDFTKDWGL